MKILILLLSLGLFSACVSTPTPRAAPVMFTMESLDEVQLRSAAAFRARNVHDGGTTYWKDELAFLPCGFGRGEGLGIQIRESDLLTLLGRPADVLSDPDGTRRMLYPLSQRREGVTEITEYLVLILHRDASCRCLFEERQLVKP